MQKGKKAARKTAVKKRLRTPWNTSEILFAVYGYLTTRKEPLIFSASHNAGAIAEILGAIVKANNLPPTRKNWKKIAIPDGLEGLTNVPKPAGTSSGDCQAEPPKEKLFDNYEAVTSKVFQLINENLDLPNQNRFLSLLLKRMADARIDFVAMREKDERSARSGTVTAKTIQNEFSQIIAGNL